MREPAGARGQRGLQACRSCLLVQGVGASPEAAESAAQAEAANDAGADAGRVPPGTGRAGRETVAVADVKPLRPPPDIVKLVVGIATAHVIATYQQRPRKVHSAYSIPILSLAAPLRSPRETVARNP